MDRLGLEVEVRNGLVGFRMLGHQFNSSIIDMILDNDRLVCMYDICAGQNGMLQ